MQEEPGPGDSFYGDTRVAADRRSGACCTFWVVPDISAGFHVPSFYADFVQQRTAYVNALEEHRERLAQERRQQRDAAASADV